MKKNFGVLPNMGYTFNIVSQHMDVLGVVGGFGGSMVICHGRAPKLVSRRKQVQDVGEQSRIDSRPILQRIAQEALQSKAHRPLFFSNLEAS